MKKRSLLKRFLEDLPLRQKFLLLYIPMLLSAALITVFLMLQVNRAVLANSLSSEETLTTQTAHVVDESLYRVTTIMDSLCSDPFLSRSTYSSRAYDYFLSRDADTYADNFFTLANSLTDHEFITDIKVYLEENYDPLVRAYQSRGILESVKDVSSSYWHGIFAGQPTRTSLFCPSFYLTNREKKNSGSLAYIRKFYNIASPNSNGAVAYVAVYFSAERMDQILRDNRHTEDTLLYLVNTREAIAASSDRRITGLYFQSYDALSRLLGVRTHFREMKILNESVFLTYRSIAQADWRMVCIIPKNSVYSGELSLFATISVILMTLFIVSILMQLLLSGSISRRILKIKRKIEKNERIAPEGAVLSGSDEVAELAVTYDEMHDRIQELLVSQQKTSEKLRVSEAKALQAQINPHFLYNILDMINWQTMSGNKEAASEAVLSLSKFYKMTLSKSDIFVPIRSEIDHVTLYVRLQNMRFEGRINFIIDVPEELMDFLIPKLVLQPIVENAILHGIQEKEEQKGTILIMGWEEGSDLIFTVSDDGVGIPDDVLPHILDQNAKSRPKGSGTNIAVYNTHQRLQLLYGEKYGLTFRSTQGAGTEVEIRIPAE